MIFAYIFLLALGIVLAAYGWFFLTLSKIGKQTAGDAFYNLTLEGRRQLRASIQKKARWMRLLAVPLTKLGMRSPVIDFEGTKVPIVCPPRTMAFARDYEPVANDIFVATQMKCGTTWMQQIVYQVLTRGEGEYSDEGHRHLYAMSPWIESTGSVSLPDAPLVAGHRIIKTHLGTNLCPYSKAAKYIYVVRHPAACLASSIDFVNKLMGPMAPQRDNFEDWFCSEDMWWGSWSDHADGWWRWSTERDNVLFVHYELLLAEPEQHIQQIADFLEIALTEAQLENAVEKSSYQYMKTHDHYFEMSPPTPFDTGDESYFVKGSSNRGDDVNAEVRQRVTSYAANKLKNASYPVADYYPDVV